MQDNILNQRHLNDALLTANIKIAELEAENEQLATKRGSEKTIKVLKQLALNSYDEVKKLRADLSALKSHDKEAMELLAGAVTDAKYLAYLVKNAGEKCNNCSKSDKSCFQSSNCWSWQHADRYKALKAQTEKQISEEKIYEK